MLLKRRARPVVYGVGLAHASTSIQALIRRVHLQELLARGAGNLCVLGLGFVRRLFVVGVGSLDSAALSDSLDADLLHLLLVLSPQIRILDLHKARRQLRLHLLDVLDAEFRSNLLQLLIDFLQFIILRLQFLFLLRILLQQLLIELHVLLF